MKRAIFALLSAVVSVALVAVPSAANDDIHAATYNLYVGADIFRLVLPAPDDPCVLAGLPPAALLPCLAAETLGIVQQTNFAERAQAIAAEIEAQRPDVIGLQEVSLIRLDVPSNFDPADPRPNAETVFLDYLDLLQGELAARGLDYVVAGQIQNADVELPAFADPQDPTAGLIDVRLTDRDVLLVRRGLEVSNVESANYTQNLVIDVGGLPVSFLRGFVAADITVGDVVYRVVNTHLEILEPNLIQSAQAGELVRRLAGETKPVVLVGDFNSAPEDVANIPVPVPYGILIFGGGFTDAWSTQAGAGDGFTCCQSETLTNVESELFQRIDLVLVRAPAGFAAEVSDVVILGADPSMKTPSGLWLSDHAGVSAVAAVVLVPREALGLIADDLDAALPTLSGKTEDNARDASAKLRDALDDERLWTADGGLDDGDGKTVFDRLKDAVKKLSEIDGPLAVLAETRDALVSLAERIAQDRLDRAVALGGDTGKIAEAVEKMTKAEQNLADGKLDGAVNEYKAAWEKARDAGGIVRVGFRGELAAVADDLGDSLPGLSGQARDKAEDAHAELRAALLKDKVWTDSGALSDGNGKEAFDRSKNAAKKLLEVDVPPAVVTDTIDMLANLAEVIAQQRIDSAIAQGGDLGKIAEAFERMAKADDEQAKGKPDKAIEERKHAWEKARDAL